MTTASNLSTDVLARYAEHLRTVHFTLVIGCLSIAALLLAAKVPRIDAAIADVQAIQRLQPLLDERTWLARASENALRAESKDPVDLAGLSASRRSLEAIWVESKSQRPVGCFKLSFEYDRGAEYWEDVPWFFDWFLADAPSDLGDWHVRWNAYDKVTIVDFILSDLIVQYADLPRDASLRTSLADYERTPGGIASYVMRAGGAWKDISPIDTCSPAREVRLELARLPAEDPARPMGFTHAYYPDFTFPGVIPAVRVPVKAKPLDVDPQEYLSSKAWAGSAKRWRVGTFEQSFPELAAFTAGLYSLQIGETQTHLENLRSSLSPEERIEFAGLRLPAELVRGWGSLLILAIQVYFWLHLRAFAVARRQLAGDFWYPWIALYPSAMARSCFVLTTVAAPLSVAYLLVVSSPSRPDRFSTVILGGVLLLAGATLAWALSFWRQETFDHGTLATPAKLQSESKDNNGGHPPKPAPKTRRRPTKGRSE